MPRRRTATHPALQRYLAEIREFPLLSPEQEQQMTVDSAGDRSAVETSLVQSNLSFVVRIAGEYQHLGVDFEELLNEGNIGLIEAARRYDSRKGHRFITYAVWWIRKAILRSVTAQATVVHVSAYHLKRQGRDRKALRVREISLDARLRADGPAFVDTIPDDSRLTAEEESIRSQHAGLLHRALRTLRPFERQVLQERFGLEGQEPRTLREVGQSMGLSRERVRQIELQGIRKIREFFFHHRTARNPYAGREWGGGRSGAEALRQTASA